MSNPIILHIVRFVFLVLFQVLVLSRVELHGFISLCIYPLFILLLPIDTPRWLSLLLGFVLGLTIDVFANTPGLHAAVTVLLAYLRPAILRLNRPPSGYEANFRPNIYDLGWRWFLVYAGIAMLIHQSAYFFLEAYSFEHFPYTLAKILASTAFSLLLLLMSEWLFARRLT